MIENLFNIISITLLLFLTIIIIVFYKFVYQTWNYFNKQNVKFVRGIPIIGAHWRSIFRLKSLGKDWIDIYNRYPNERFIGVYGFFGVPSYLIRDPKLAEQISIKDFQYFTNHYLDIKDDCHDLMSRTLLNMRDQRWKDMRTILTPTFTGSKMKLMFQLITDETKRFSVFLKNDDQSSAGKEYELKNLLGRLSSDTIASVSFGIENNALDDANNIFFRTGQSITKRGFILFLYRLIPKIFHFLNIGIFDKSDLAFFQKLAKDNIAYREKSNFKRNDMIDLLVEAKKGVVAKYQSDTKDENIGFATVDESYMKALDKTGIANIEKQLNSKTVTYEAIKTMKYLDMVLSEALRRWALPASDRLVKKPYLLENHNGDKVKLYPGEGLWLPIQAIHMDEKYYPNPTKFDPERFSDENRANIINGTFSPFGAGPRSCIASRFALMQSKAVIYQLVLQFHIERTDKTQDPLQLKVGTQITDAENGFWLKFRPRVVQILS